MRKGLFPDAEGIRTTLSSFGHSDTSLCSAGFYLKSALVWICLSVAATHWIKWQWTLSLTDAFKRTVQLRFTLSVEITLEKNTRSWERKRGWKEKNSRRLIHLNKCIHDLDKSSFPDEQELVPGWARDWSRMNKTSFPDGQLLVPGWTFLTRAFHEDVTFRSNKKYISKKENYTSKMVLPRQQNTSSLKK